jgi:ATP-dependent protease HslVU (ClpYQ) peptidase subunit
VLDKADMIIEKEGESIFARVVIFLAYKDVLFEICSNFIVLQYEEFQAIGDGFEYAQGTMLNTKDSDDINDRIVRALDIVSSYNYHVGRPYVLINSKDLQYKVIGG